MKNVSTEDLSYFIFFGFFFFQILFLLYFPTTQSCHFVAMGTQTIGHALCNGDVSVGRHSFSSSAQGWLWAGSNQICALDPCTVLLSFTAGFLPALFTSI